MKKSIIPIFIPHYGCKNACVFCNQHKITGVETDITVAKVREIIAYYLGIFKQVQHIEVAFYGGSFTAIPVNMQKALLSAAHEFLIRREISGIRLSTRPDCIAEDTLERLAVYGVKTIEIGAQSFVDDILQKARRGHSTVDIERAVRLIRERNFTLGIQLMPGLPGDTWLTIMRTLLRTIAQKPDFVRIYPTIVLKDTQLAEMYQAGLYTPLSMDLALKYCMVMKQSFEAKGITVIRTGLQATDNLNNPEIVLAGPYHPAFGEMVESYGFYLRIARLLEQLPLRDRNVIVYHHPADTSKLRGNKNSNTLKWLRKYRLESIAFKPVGTVKKQIVLESDRQSYFIGSQEAFHKHD